MNCNYRVLVRDDQIGNIYRFSEYPNLKLKYIGYENRLCPSYYTDVVCVSPGYLQVTFEVNGKEIVLRNYQKTEEILTIDDREYMLRGCEFLVEGNSRDQTWLYFNIKS